MLCPRDCGVFAEGAAVVRLMEFLSIAWAGGILLYFWKTTPRDRQDYLLLIWVLMALPVFYWLIRLALA